MKIEDKIIKLKDGRDAIIRSPKEDDAKAVLDFITKACEETIFLSRYGKEWADVTVEKEQDFLDNMNKSETDAMLICEVDGKPIGNCNISWNKGIKTGHRARIGIAILREYWNQGIGTAFFLEMIKIAEEDGGIIQLELDFLEGNGKAQALYEKMGFRITGVKPDACRLEDGTLLNEYSMIRKI